jgi:hypothetical protein
LLKRCYIGGYPKINSKEITIHKLEEKVVMTEMMEEMKMGAATWKALEIVRDVIGMIRIGDICARVGAIRSIKEVNTKISSPTVRAFVVQILVYDDRSTKTNLIIGFVLEKPGMPEYWMLMNSEYVGIQAVTFGPPEGRRESMVNLPCHDGKFVFDQRREEFMALIKQILC